MRTPNKFIDPATGETYEWIINHNEEQALGAKRSISYSAPTNTEVGLGRQQGDSSPRVISVKGVILRKVQFDEFVKWYKRCEGQTIYFQDFAGELNEVTITSFMPTRRRVARNHQDLVNMPLWVYDYTMEMDVVRPITGAWAA